MRADRLLSILLLLQVHRKMTAHDLSERLEVSERTIHRDMGALGTAGVPVLAERGTGGGWRLLDGYRTNLTGLNDAEIEAVFLTKPARLMADLGLEKASDAALLKLLAALPVIHRDRAEYVRQRIHVDVTGWHRPEETVPCLPALQAAIWHERRVRIAYARNDGAAVERVVEPYGLVAKGSIWYLVAAVEGELRTYRVSRMQAATLTDESFERPADFDLAAHWQQSSVQFTRHLPRYAAHVRVNPDLLPRLRLNGRYARIEHEYDADPDGWIPLDMAFEDDHGACEAALGYGAQMEVLEPTELREAVLKRAAEVLTFYAQRGG